jgi:hypothetical protein
VNVKLLVIAATLVLAGCVEADPNNKDNEWVDKTYRTGSNIPRKTSPQADGVGVMNKQDYDNYRIQANPSISCNPFMGCGSPSGH